MAAQSSGGSVVVVVVGVFVFIVVIVNKGKSAKRRGVEECKTIVRVRLGHRCPFYRPLFDQDSAYFCVLIPLWAQANKLRQLILMLIVSRLDLSCLLPQIISSVVWSSSL